MWPFIFLVVLCECSIDTTFDIYIDTKLWYIIWQQLDVLRKSFQTDVISVYLLSLCASNGWFIKIIYQKTQIFQSTLR